MSRILVLMTLAAATLVAKDRVYQTGTLLDKSLNPYIRTTESGDSGLKSNEFMNGTVMVAVNANRSAGAVTYEDYVVEVDDTVYLIEVAHMKTYKAPRLSLSRPLNVAVEKNKLYIKDLDNAEYSGDILKQVPKNGPKESGLKQGDQLAAVETKPARALKPDVAPPAPKTQEAKAPAAAVATAVTTKTPAKPDPFAVASAKVASQPPPAAAAPIQSASAVQPVAEPPAPKPAPKVETPKVEAAVTKAPEKSVPSGLATPKDPKPAPKVEAPKVEALVTKPAERAAPAPKPESVRQEPQGGSRSQIKDRAWQSGQLLSIVNNSYFFNVTYSADTEGTSWPFTQGSDGRFTVNSQIGNPTTSLYTYDNYVIESQFVVYLVQRMRPKTSPPVRLPGTQALKFAVEKNKLWVMDEQNIEYETKVVKLVQKETIVDPLTRAAARN